MICMSLDIKNKEIKKYYLLKIVKIQHQFNSTQCYLLNALKKKEKQVFL
jgi:hypothetical protein